MRFPRGLLTAVGLFALAFAVRALPWRNVLTSERVYFFGNDAYYHVRRALYSVIHFPAALEFDTYINHPQGAKPIWTPVFDWLIAASARPFMRKVSEGGLEDLERFAAWVPAVIGAVTVVAVFALTRRHFGYGAAVIAGLVLSLLSGHFWYSQVGFVDHHVLVGLTTTGVLAGAMALLTAAAAGRKAWWEAVATGAAIGLTLLVWPGSLLHVGIAEVGLLCFLLSRADAGAAAGFAARLAVVHGVALALVAPLSLGNEWPRWGAFSPVVLSGFQPWLFAAAIAWSLLCAAVFARPRTGGTRPRRAIVAFGVGLGLLASSVAVVPGLAAGAEDAWRWLAKEEAFQVVVAESQPLLMSDGFFVLHIAMARLSTFALLLPLALPVVVWAARRRGDRATVWLFVWWTAALFGVTLLQRRFFNTSSIALAIAFGVCVCGGYRALPAAVLDRRWPRRFAAAALAGFSVFLLLPTLKPYYRPVRNEWAIVQGEKLRVAPSFAITRAGVEIAAWIRAKTPETAGWLQPWHRPEYGVLAPWHLGHVIKHVGRRPTVVDNFGDDVGAESYAWSVEYYASSESAMLPGLEGRRVRYVVAQRGAHELGEKPRLGTLHHSLYLLDGSRFEPDATMGLREVPALERHRLVFESHAAQWKDPEAPPVYKVYEVVAGARIEGEAPPGTPVRFRLRLRTNRKRAIDWESSAIAGADGRYRARLPHATVGSPGSVRTRPFYVVSCPGEQRRMRVTEPQVQEGRLVAGPSLCASKAAGG